uniref:Uncharacterized protein n=1 Tax=Glossina pallidipes TaxID=7398 RepID=A0A1A9ZXE6_GLOPL
MLSSRSGDTFATESGKQHLSVSGVGICQPPWSSFRAKVTYGSKSNNEFNPIVKTLYAADTILYDKVKDDEERMSHSNLSLILGDAQLQQQAPETSYHNRNNLLHPLTQNCKM